MQFGLVGGVTVALLFVGDDWAEDHHDVEVQDHTGRRLVKARLPEGIAGIARLHVSWLRPERWCTSSSLVSGVAS